MRPSTRPLMKEIQHFIFQTGKEKHRSRGKYGTSTEDTERLLQETKVRPQHSVYRIDTTTSTAVVVPGSRHNNPV